MKYALLVLLSCLSLMAHAQNLAALDKKNGFRDAIFGADIASFRNMTLIDQDGDNKTFVRSSDATTMGKGQLSRIVYSFYKGKLYGVVLTAKGSANSQAVLRVLQADYGTGQKLNPALESYLWESPRVRLTFMQTGVENSSNVFLFSKPLLLRMEQEKSKK